MYPASASPHSTGDVNPRGVYFANSPPVACADCVVNFFTASTSADNAARKDPRIIRIPRPRIFRAQLIGRRVRNRPQHPPQIAEFDCAKLSESWLSNTGLKAWNVHGAGGAFVSESNRIGSSVSTVSTCPRLNIAFQMRFAKLIENIGSFTMNVANCARHAAPPGVSPVRYVGAAVVAVPINGRFGRFP